jgi:HD superfamily phosphodiesterase
MDYPKAIITEALIQFFGNDYRRIEHALSVLHHALRIAENSSGSDSEVLIASALLHDVGIKPAEKIHGYNNGPLQEKYGPPEAERILQCIGMDNDRIRKISEIIGNHHSRSRYDYIELAILKEADAIVNRMESER